ncbi:MAG: pilus assembly protein N-terminal domain-containing protein [Hyphomicrobiaceae bacterium]
MSAFAFRQRRSLSSPISVFLTASAALAAVALEIPAARANDLIVKYDQSQLLRLPRPAAEIIIGNPTIADVSVQGGNLLVVTGKSFGITNIISLDADRNIIQDQRVLVQRDEVRVVNLQKGAKRESYNCAPQCNPSITIGDDPAYFASVAANTERKLKASEGASEGGGAASN